MYKIIIAVIATVGMYAVVINLPSTMTVESPTIETMEVVTQPEWTTDEDAVKAAQDVIKKKELQAEQAHLEAVLASTTKRIEAIEQELGF
jgi:hypothetical protein